MPLLTQRLEPGLMDQLLADYPPCQHLAPGTWHLAPGTWHLAPGTWHLAPGTWHLAPGRGVPRSNTAVTEILVAHDVPLRHQGSVDGRVHR
jgi:hypothetical protein